MTAHENGNERGCRHTGSIGVLALSESTHFEFDRDDAPARQAIDAALEKISGTTAVVVGLPTPRNARSSECA